ncbi:MAG TPA: hypothetical protein VK699_18485 [Terriglobales bacterium]|jgi:hypothetical protein|nr:hypothetical protein [Terriglobales bacterium]
MAGYSGTPLIKKLGIKEGFSISIVETPADVLRELGISSKKRTDKRPFDFVLLSVRTQEELRTKFPLWAARLAPAGMLWISWPKKSSGVESDLNENIVRDIGLAAGLVDVKICAVNETWSGLKFVIRLKDRPANKAKVRT